MKKSFVLTCRGGPLALVAMLLPVALAGCHKAPATPDATQGKPADGLIAMGQGQIARLGIALATVETSEAVPVGTVPGTVSLPPDARVAVTTPFAGTVVKVMVIQGQTVTRGQALAVVRAAETVQFGAALARSQAQLPVAAAQAARMEQLAREGIIAPARAEEARANLKAAQASLAENRRLLTLGAAAADGTITLRAPIAGRITTVGVDAGSPVGTGPAPFLIENNAQVRLDLQIPERLAAQVRPGMAVHVGQDGHVVTGRLLSLASTIDPSTRALSAKASLPPDTGLLPGKSVMVTLADAGAGQGKRGPGVSVPSEAVTHIGDHDAVFRREASGFRVVSVTVAGQIGARTIVSGGLAPGQQVAASSIAELKSLSQGD